MGLGIKFTEAQWDELDRLRFTSRSADVFRNCLSILMSDSRDTIPEIAHRHGCGTDIVVTVRRVYRQVGIQALHAIKPPRRPSRANVAYIAEMKRAVPANPRDLCYAVVVLGLLRR